MNSPWASPFMGSAGLMDSYDEELTNIQASRDSKSVEDISTWWTHNSKVVDSTSLNDMLVDSGNFILSLFNRYISLLYRA